MGNCCKVDKKEKEISKPVVDSGTMITDDRSQRTKYLQIFCENPSISLSIRYRSAIPIQDIKEQIISEYPNFEIEKYSLYRDDLEILDATATLQQLGIVPGDTLTLKIFQVSDYSEDIIASENNSIPEIQVLIIYCFAWAYVTYYQGDEDIAQVTLYTNSLLLCSEMIIVGILQFTIFPLSDFHFHPVLKEKLIRHDIKHSHDNDHKELTNFS